MQASLGSAAAAVELAETAAAATEVDTAEVGAPGASTTAETRGALSPVPEEPTAEAEGADVAVPGSPITAAPARVELAAPSVGQSTEAVASAPSRYRLVREIGKGSFGEVHLAEGPDGRQVALKRCTVPLADKDTYRREFQLLEKISHPCVVKLLEVADRPASGGRREVDIVMEFLPENLHRRIKGAPLPADVTRLFSFQLLRALAHLDTLRICHRDVKPENVLLAGLALKLADFGSAKELGQGPSESYICSRWWRAPELILGACEYGTCVDWWSGGCVIGEMMLGQPLFQGPSNSGQMYSIVRILGTPTPEEVHALSDSQEGTRLGKHLAKLAELQRSAKPWAEVLPAFAGHPLALELLPRLLAYTPQARSHPAQLLVSPFFMELAEADDLSEFFSQSQFWEFPAEELSGYSRAVRRGLRRLAGTCKRKQRGADRDSPSKKGCPAGAELQKTKRRRSTPGEEEDEETAAGSALKRRRCPRSRSPSPVRAVSPAESQDSDL